MLSEQDLNRIKGLLHFLNGEGKPATRDVSPAVEHNRPKSNAKFIVLVFNGQGDQVGQIKPVSEGTRDDYAFFVG